MKHTFYLVGAENMHTWMPRAHPQIQNLPRLFTVWRNSPGEWMVRLFDKAGAYRSRYRSGTDAIGAVRTALDSGLFLGYPE